MTRKVFFSFEYSDVWRANVVRKSWVAIGREAAGFIDAAEIETIRRRGDDAIRRWIDTQMAGTSVTVVLVGAETCKSKWVKYEVERTISLGKGLLQVNISMIKDQYGKTSNFCGGVVPSGYMSYLWFKGDGNKNLGSWIELAAQAAGR
ncbi:MAG: TIR domain-containing protein [Anaerolineales bacterium]|nr:TIR domain-containing protein [Anaerolineales bacterium]